MEVKCVELSVPADRSMLLIIRMTTAGVMSRAGMTLDEMDDMKMAVDEACNMMLLQKPSCDMLSLRYVYSDESVSICIEGVVEDNRAADISDGTMQEVIRCILETIVDKISITPRADGSIGLISLEKQIPRDRRRSAV